MCPQFLAHPYLSLFGEPEKRPSSAAALGVAYYYYLLDEREHRQLDGTTIGNSEMQGTPSRGEYDHTQLRGVIHRCTRSGETRYGQSSEPHSSSRVEVILPSNRNILNSRR